MPACTPPAWWQAGWGMLGGVLFLVGRFAFDVTKRWLTPKLRVET